MLRIRRFCKVDFAFAPRNTADGKDRLCKPSRHMSQARAVRVCRPAYSRGRRQTEPAEILRTPKASAVSYTPTPHTRPRTPRTPQTLQRASRPHVLVRLRTSPHLKAESSKLKARLTLRNKSVTIHPNESRQPRLLGLPPRDSPADEGTRAQPYVARAAYARLAAVRRQGPRRRRQHLFRHRPQVRQSPANGLPPRPHTAR